MMIMIMCVQHDLKLCGHCGEELKNEEDFHDWIDIPSVQCVGVLKTISNHTLPVNIKIFTSI